MIIPQHLINLLITKTDMKDGFKKEGKIINIVQPVYYACKHCACSFFYKNILNMYICLHCYRWYGMNDKIFEAYLEKNIAVIYL